MGNLFRSYLKWVIDRKLAAPSPTYRIRNKRLYSALNKVSRASHTSQLNDTMDVQTYNKLRREKILPLSLAYPSSLRTDAYRANQLERVYLQPAALLLESRSTGALGEYVEVECVDGTPPDKENGHNSIVNGHRQIEDLTKACPAVRISANLTGPAHSYWLE